MNKHRFLRRLLLLVLMAVLALSGCQAASFRGNRVCNPDRYTLDFSYMAGEDSWLLALEASDTLHMEWEIRKGTVNIALLSESGESVYRANGVGRREAASFEVVIPETGTYTIRVSAAGAEGYIEIRKSEK